MKSQKDFEQLPFTTKSDLREAYPLGLLAVPESEVVRIHSSSGTTGTPVIIPYTQQDVTDWAIQFARCYEYAGITKDDRTVFSNPIGFVYFFTALAFNVFYDKSVINFTFTAIIIVTGTYCVLGRIVINF